MNYALAEAAKNTNNVVENKTIDYNKKIRKNRIKLLT